MYVKLSTLLCAAIISISSVAMAIVPTPNQLWQFDNNLNGDILGGSTGVANGGWTPAYVTNPAGLPGATVLSVPDFATTESFQVNNNVGANGGGLYTNNWTIMMDIMVPDYAADYTSILQTSPTQSNDVDVYVDKSDNHVEYWDGNTAAGVVTNGTWYRWTLTREAGVGTNFYINGVLVPEVLDFGTPLDGHISFDPVFHLFGDDNGQNNAKLVNSVAYWSTPLSGADVASFGGPTAAGIVVVPEPSTCVLASIGLAGLALAARRKR